MEEIREKLNIWNRQPKEVDSLVYAGCATGLSFHNYPMYATRIKKNDRLIVQAVKDNPFDPKATGLFFVDAFDGNTKRQIGWIPKALNSVASDRLLSGYELDAVVTKNDPSHYDPQKTSLDLNKIDMDKIDFESDCYLAIDEWDVFINLNDFFMYNLDDLVTNYDDDDDDDDDDEGEEHYFLIVKDLKLNIEAPTFKKPLTFNIGDKVKIVQRIKKELGWHNQWVPKMDKFVNDGKKYTIVDISDMGVQLKDTNYR